MLGRGASLAEGQLNLPRAKWHHMWVPAGIPDPPLPIPLPDSGLGNTTEDSLNVGAPVTHKRYLEESPGSSMTPTPPLQPSGD